MSIVGAGALLLALVLVQVTWLPNLTLIGSDPNLVLLAVCGWTWLRGPRAGLWWAIAGGLLLDLAAPGPIGVHAIALLAAAYCTGLVAGRLDRGLVLVPAATGAAASLVYGLTVLGGAETLGQSLPPPAVARLLLLGGALYTALLMPPAVLALGQLERLLTGPESELW